MAIITNYATLKTAIADYLARDDLTTFIPNFVQAAERELDARLNLRNEETALSVDVSSGVAAVPSDFKALKFAYYNGNTAIPLQWVTLEELYRDYPSRSSGASSSPSVISREAGNFIFGPVAADGTAALKGVYYATQDSLETTDPSWYVSNHPEVLVYGACREAALFIQNMEMYQFWDKQFEQRIGFIRQQECSETVPTQGLVIRTA